MLPAVTVMADGPGSLIHHWPLHGSSSDAIGNADPTLVGPGFGGWIHDPEWDADVLSINAAATGNHALRIASNLETNNDSLTLAFWARPNLGASGLNNFISLESMNVPDRTQWDTLFFFSHGGGYLGLNNSDDTFDEFTLAPRWTHFALTFNGNEARLYVDGAAFGSPVANVRVPTLDVVEIGGVHASQFFNGRMADVRLYSGVLSLAEIQAVRALAPADVLNSVEEIDDTPPTPALIHHWPMTYDGSYPIIAADVVGGRDATRVWQNATFENDNYWDRHVLEIQRSADARAAHVSNIDIGNAEALTVLFWAKQPASQFGNLLTLESMDIADGTAWNTMFFFSYENGTLGLDNGGAVFGSHSFVDTWSHFALVFDDEEAALFVNGQPLGSPITTNRLPALDVFAIGGYLGGQLFEGRIADVRLYNHARTELQIMADITQAPDAVLAQAGITPPGNVLPLHHWLMDGSGANIGTSGRPGQAFARDASFVYDVAWGEYVLEINPASAGYGGNNIAPFTAPGAVETFTDVTFTMWVREDVRTRGNFHFLLRGLGGFAIGRATDGQLFISHEDFIPPLADQWGNVLTPNIVFPTTYQSGWVHLAFTMGSGVTVFYVNGVEVGQAPVAAPISIDAYHIGGNEWQGQIFPGRIADFRVYDTVLTPAEIYDIFDDVTLNDEPSFLELSARTSLPNSNLFTQGQAANIALTASGIEDYDGTEVTVDWRIVDWLDAVVASGSHNFPVAGGDVQTATIPLPTNRLGWFNFEASTIQDGETVTLPNQGTMQTNSLPFGVINNPAGRRINGTYGWHWDGTTAHHSVIPGPNGEGIDEHIFFGIWNSMVGIMADGVDVSRVLGSAMSTTSAYSWRLFMNPPLTTTAMMTPNHPEWEPNRTTNLAYLNALAVPGHRHTPWQHETYAGSNLRGHMHQLLELTPYFPHEFRVHPGLGAYGGQMNALGEQEFEQYIRAIARIHIHQAPLRPHHYFMPLWEPNYQWGAWFPGGQEGIDSIVRAHQIAYEAIHDEYHQMYLQTGDPSWLTKPVVLGPNSSTFYPSWHQQLFDAGLANYIDGLTIHTYHENPNDHSYINLTRQVMQMSLDAFENRANPKVHDRFFFFATEEGFRSGEAIGGGATGLEMQMNVLTRHMLIMLGEGFDHFQMFIFHDGPAETATMGMFYSLSGEHFGASYIAPKPVATAFSAASYLLAGYETGGPLALGGTNIGYAYLDTLTDSVKLALWNFAGTSTVNVNVGVPSVFVYDIMGNRQSVATPGGVLAITLTQSVQYVSGVNPDLFRGEENLVISNEELFIGDELVITAKMYNDGPAIQGYSLSLSFDAGLGIADYTLTGVDLVQGENIIIIPVGRVPFATSPGEYTVNAALIGAGGVMVAIDSATVSVLPKVEIVLAQNFYDFAASQGAIALLLRNNSDEAKTVSLRVLEGPAVLFSPSAFAMQPGEEVSVLVPLPTVDILIGADLIIELTYLDSGNNVVQSQEHEASFIMMNYQPSPLPMTQISHIDTWHERMIPIWRGPEHQYTGAAPTFVPGLTADNLSGFLYFGWDAGGVWFGADITDDIHMNNTTAPIDIWQGDAIQLNFNVNHLGDLAGSEWATGEIVSAMGFALNASGPTFNAWGIAPGSTGPGPDFTVLRDEGENRTVYMAFIPWEFLGLPVENVRAGFQLGVAASINDRDIPGSFWNNQTALVLFDGIIGGGGFSQFGVMALVSNTEFILAPRLRAEAGQNQVNLHWSEAIPGADSYRIYVNNTYHTTVPGGITSYTVTGLTNDTEYNFHVVAIGAGFNPGMSNTVTATPTGGPDIPDREALRDAITEVEGLNHGDFTRLSWALLHQVYMQAVSLYNNEHATAQQLEDMTDRLWDAIDALVLIAPPPLPQADKAQLIAAIEIAETFVVSEFTRLNWVLLQDALNHARLVVNNEYATQEQVNAALNRLNATKTNRIT